MVHKAYTTTIQAGVKCALINVQMHFAYPINSMVVLILIRFCHGCGDSLLGGGGGGGTTCQNYVCDNNN